MLLIVRLCALGLDVLLDAVDGGLVGDKALLDLIEAVVNLILEDHVTASVMLHGVVGRLLGHASAVGADLLADGLETLLLGLVLSLEFVKTGELVVHFVFHAVDVLLVDLHLLVHTTLQVGDLLQIGLTSLNLDLEGGSSALSFIQLSLLEVKISLHLFDLVDAWESGLAVHILRHMLKQGSDSLLIIVHLLLELLLFRFVLLSKLIDLLLLGVENFKLLFSAHSLAALSWLVAELVVDVLDVSIVLINHLFEVVDLLVLLLDLGVVLLDAVHKALSGLWEGQVVLVALELKIILSLLKLGLLFAEMLGALLQVILLQTILSLHQSLADILELLALHTNLALKEIVFRLELLVFVALLRVQIVEAGLVCEVDVADLLLVRVKFVLHVAFLSEQVIEVRSLLVVLVLDVHVQGLDILRLGVTSVLIESQVVIGEVSFKLTNILDESLIFALKIKIGSIVFIDVLYLLLHLGDLRGNIIVLGSQQVVVIVAIVDLSSWSSVQS